MWFIAIKADSEDTQNLSCARNYMLTKEDHKNKSTMLRRMRKLQIKHPYESYSLVYVDSLFSHDLISKLQ